MHTSTGNYLMEMYDLLFDHFGPQHWWPGDTALEIMLGAILTQNTNWQNVEKAISNLKAKEWLSIDKIHTGSMEELAQTIRPAGYYNVKAKRLRNLIDHIWDIYDGDIDRFLDQDRESLRIELLNLKGVGPETADSILLYAAGMPVFVVDAYSYRILNQHGMGEEQMEYHELQALFTDNLSNETQLFNEFHALIVRTGKEYCRKKPKCSECPLNQWGPILPEI